ncbi:MAG TPA: YihY/virulence factor BrkB family protein [Clostridiales bacterium]|nr:YihY/virulence factor BrkB family protein [Clostridiales bacterium]
MMIYKYIPNKDKRCNTVLPGAVFSTIGLYFFSYLFSIYVDNFGKFSQMYGSVGGLFFLFTWLYSSSVVILLGAEINGQYSEGRN